MRTSVMRCKRCRLMVNCILWTYVQFAEKRDLRTSVPRTCTPRMQPLAIARRGENCGDREDRMTPVEPKAVMLPIHPVNISTDFFSKHKRTPLCYDRCPKAIAFRLFVHHKGQSTQYRSSRDVPFVGMAGCRMAGHPATRKEGVLWCP